MNGKELKELLVKLIHKDNLDEGICQDLLDDLTVIGNQDVAPDKIDDIITRLNSLYKFQYSNNHSWSELNDREFANWKRVRAAIEHENTLHNQRLTWLISSQTVLISAYTLTFIEWSKKIQNSSDIFNVYPALMITLAFFGIILSFYIWRALNKAVIQINKLERWWYGEREWKELLAKSRIWESKPYKNEGQLIINHPPLSGKIRSRFDLLINTEQIPLLFILAWLLIIIFSGIYKGSDIIEALSKIWQLIFIALGITIFIISITINIILLRRLSSNKPSKNP